MDGILALWKPKGWTSHDCVMKARKLLKTKKVGHTGTLDPDVEGVLPLCIGTATKIVPFLTDTRKDYDAVVCVGSSTDTEDASGEVISEKVVDPALTLSEVEQVIKQFEGEITQIPPMYSAVKVNGKKLYEYARKGETVERPSRKVQIHQIELLSSSLSEQDGKVHFPIRVTCSKGTYIRTLCVDIGAALGYPAHMAHLVRTRTGDFGKEDCYSIEEVEKHATNDSVSQILLPMERGLNHIEAWTVDEGLAERIKFGQVLNQTDDLPDSNPFRVVHEGKTLAIYQRHPAKEGKIKPVRVFN
ncbi:tRNA pseudouridine(55) synthase TruB [Thalassobacillus hwangdonensis]|uniref:tRNA pseudouridine synthase B n=1 Tax=Thalassobacillus hwangdonensis TaxID=546108 RepID=A0ABW3KYB3_9BACI